MAEAIKTRKARPVATPYLEGKRYAIRKRYKGNDIYLSGFDSEEALLTTLRHKMVDIDKHGLPAGRGADKTTLAQALQDYAIKRLPFLKGAVQEARRINHYLRYAGLELLVVIPRTQEEQTPGAGDKEEGAEKKKTGAGAYFEVKLEPHTPHRKIAKGLRGHRKAQLTQNAGTEKHRAVLATTKMSELKREKIQALVDAMREDNNAPATIALERSMLRVLFYYAHNVWRWPELQDNPAQKLKMPKVDNERERVMSKAEQDLLDTALADCRNALVAPVVTLLRETAMRASEPLEQARWRDVDWERRVLTLRDSKTGEGYVPLSPVALQMLRELGPGEPNERIVQISYEALRASWQRACKRAGVKDLHLHDLRRTAGTRLALKTGNVFLVKALTRHKTLAMVQRYIRVGVDDVAAFMHRPDGAESAAQPTQPRPASAPQEAPVSAASGPKDGKPMFTHEQMQTMVQMSVDMAMARLHSAPDEQPAAQAVVSEEGVVAENVVPLRRAA